MRCERCDRPAQRTLGRQHLCHRCTEDILTPIRERLNRADTDGHGGIGRAQRLISARLGDYHLECDTCTAGWVGQPDEPCPWCRHADRHREAEQRWLLLHPQLPDPDNPRYDHAVNAWLERLHRAVLTNLVTEHDAHTAERLHRHQEAA